jgi:hypothetical protein
VIRSPITNKGVPVCFFVTDAERTSILVQWFTWLKTQLGPLSVKKIMIDCSATEISAIKETFGSDVSILLCHWHIKRAWEKHLKTNIKIHNSTKETVQARNIAGGYLNAMMYAETQEDFYVSFAIFKDKHEHSFPVFFCLFYDKLVRKN